jgi:hypothetical protein
MDFSNLSESYAVKAIGITVIVVLILYYSYKAIVFYNNRKEQEPTWFGMRDFFGNFKDTTRAFDIPSRRLKYSEYGKEYTYCFWIKVENWNYLYGKAKHILHKGLADMSVMNPGVFLHPTKNQLIVRVDSKETANVYHPKRNTRIEGSEKINEMDETNESDCRKECNFNEQCGSFTLDKLANKCTFYKNANKSTAKDWDARPGDTVAHSTSYLKVKSMDPDGFSQFELDALNPCDIIDLPLQRWNHIGIVLWNRSLDVYLNGKLARSCALRDIPNINDGNLYVTQRGGFRGDMASLRYFNRALNAAEIYEIYSQGQDRMSLAKRLLPNIKITFKAEAAEEEP